LNYLNEERLKPREHRYGHGERGISISHNHAKIRQDKLQDPNKCRSPNSRLNERDSNPLPAHLAEAIDGIYIPAIWDLPFYVARL